MGGMEEQPGSTRILEIVPEADQVISYVGDAAIEESQVAEVLGVADRTLTRTIVAALARGDAGQALAACETATATRPRRAVSGRLRRSFGTSATRATPPRAPAAGASP